MSQQPTGRPGKLRITAEDLDTPEVGARIDQLRAAQAAPLVRPVGTAGPQTGRGPWWRGNVPTLAVVGLVGGLIGWAGAELVARPDSEHPWYGGSVNVGTILFVGVFAVALGFALGLWDGIQARSRAKMLLAAGRLAPFMIGASVAGGFVAQQVFTGMVEAAYRRALDDNSVKAFQSSLHLARGIAFAIAAGSLGLALGGAGRSGRRAVNAGIGGLVGGFAGGFLFDYVSEWLDAESGTAPRLVALTLCGAMVGVGIGLVPLPSRVRGVPLGLRPVHPPGILPRRADAGPGRGPQGRPGGLVRLAGREDRAARGVRGPGGGRADVDALAAAQARVRDLQGEVRRLRDADRAPRPPAPRPVVRYRVGRGDTLSRIALFFYGDAAGYPRIVAANRGLDADRLAVGQLLTVPLDPVAGEGSRS